MNVHKVNTNEEIRKAIKTKPELEKAIMVESELSELIKTAVERRKNKNIFQEEIANKGGLTQQMVSRIEKVTYTPRLDNFIRYLDAMDLRLVITEK